MYESVAGNMDMARDKMKRNYDHGSKVSDISPGDWALVKDEARTDSLSPMYRRPWKVLERNGVNVHLKVPGLGGTRVVNLNRCKNSPAPVGGTNDRAEDGAGSASQSEGQASQPNAEDGNSGDTYPEEELRDITPELEPRRSTKQRRVPDRYGEWVCS